jgi:rhodanese-related sulfurtransferase
MRVIDLREEHEWYETVVESTVQQIINIPTRHIQFNIQTIETWSQEGKVYLLCRTSHRSDKVKSKWFSQNENVISIKGGIVNGKEELHTLQCELHPGKGGYGFQQKMQSAFCAILVIILAMMLCGCSVINQKLWVIGTIGFMLYQITQKSCVLSMYLFPPI